MIIPFGFFKKKEIASGPVSITDSFNRVDSNGLGATDTGQAWTTGGFGIISNKAYLRVLFSNQTATVDTGVLNYSITATPTDATGEWGLVARYVDDSNYLAIKFASGYWLYITTRVSGTNTNLAAIGFTSLPNDTVVRVDILNNSVNVYMDDVLKATADLGGVLSTGTKAGLFSNATSGQRWDNFTITELE